MKRKIFLVDDETDLRLAISFKLRNAGYEVFEIVEGQEVLDRVRAVIPDLIILDIFLPGMNGDKVVQILKNDENLKSIPIILISAFSESLKEKFEACGADSYLAKPFASAELLSMIKKHIG